MWGFFLLFTAHPSYPGVLEPFYLAVCVCPCCHLLCHTHVPHCPGSPGNHVLLHPEVLPSGIPVRKSLEHHHSGNGNGPCSAEEQCRAALCLNLVLSRLWHCLQVGQIHYSGNVILQVPLVASRASERHEQGFCA